jgi:oligosaccharyltransferase complex subunit alpha (ribophorin I)
MLHNLKMMKVLVLLVCVLACALAESLKHSSVHKEVQIIANLEKLKVDLNLVNTGSTDVKQYRLLLTKNEQSRLSYALALFDPNDETTYTELHHNSKAKGLPNGYVEYLLNLQKPLQPGASLSFTLRLALLHPTEPLPAKVTQSEQIFQRYRSNGKFFSPYDSDEQISEFNVGTTVVKSYSEVSGVKSTVSGESITYLWGSVPANTNEPISLHFRAEKSFVTFKQVIRDIEISQWGNVAVQEQYEVVNTAAGFHGGFSRLDYQMNPARDTAHNFETFTAILPASVSGVYYRDYLGNVTTSNFRQGRKSSVLDLRSRFPLMPSWNADFFFGYHVPSQDLLFIEKESGRLVLDTRFGSPLKTGVIDELIVRVILPEGASDIKYDVPFEVDASTTLRYTYLDTIGRPLLEFRKRNVVPFHNKMFQVSYSFPSFYIFREPLYLVFGFMMFFLASLGYTRIASTFSGSSKSKSAVSETVSTQPDTPKAVKKSKK